MAWGVRARSPVGINDDGVLSYSIEMDPWDHAMQFARRVDAERFLALIRRQGFEAYGMSFHVVDLGAR